MKYPFSQIEFNKAVAEWNCNCGPSALAFACQMSLDKAHAAIPDFDAKGYTSPTMMKRALETLGQKWNGIQRTDADAPSILDVMFHHQPSLVRIQWCGPWTSREAKPKWAYRKTHWICTWIEPIPWLKRSEPYVFDCNSGIIEFDRWDAEIVPNLTALYPRADGKWFPTHVWTLKP